MLHGQPGFAIADRISKALPPPIMAKDIPLSGIFDPKHERYAEAAEVRTLIETDPEVGKIFDTARGLEGLIRNAGVHACAVILSAEPLMDVDPAVAARRRLGHHRLGLPVVRGHRPAEDGLPRPAQPHRHRRRDRQHQGQPRRSTSTSTRSALDDKDTYELLVPRRHARRVPARRRRRCATCCAACSPPASSDIAAVLRAVPAGPDGHERPQRLRRPQERPAEDHADPPRARGAARARSSRETYRLIVYQEQIMAIAQQLAGYSLGGPTCCAGRWARRRRRSSTKEFEGFDGEGMTRPSGFSTAAIKALWDVMLPFAGYAFNKSHAAGYGLVVVLDGLPQGQLPGRVHGRAADLGRRQQGQVRGLPVRVPPLGHQGAAAGRQRVRACASPPSAPTSASASARCATSAPTSSSRSSRPARTRARTPRSPTSSTRSELVCCNKRVIESLIKAGAFDSLGHTRLSLVQVHEEAVDAVVGLKRQEAMGQFDLFGGDDDDAGVERLVSVGAPASSPPRSGRASSCWATSGRCSGLYVSAHPLDGAERMLRKHAPKPIAEIIERRAQGGRDRARPA